MLSNLVCNPLIFAVPLGKLLIFPFAIRFNESNFSISLSKSACSLGVIRPSFLISFILLMIFVCAALASAITFWLPKLVLYLRHHYYLRRSLW